MLSGNPIRLIRWRAFVLPFFLKYVRDLKGGMLMFVLVLDMLASLSIVASIPVLTLVDDFRLALCLLGTGIAVHIVLRWYFSFDFASKPARFSENSETFDNERKYPHE